MDDLISIFLKLGLTLLLAGVIGIEREITGHKAGIRTLILVGIGASSFVMLADQIDIPDSETGRIIAGVATGLGFLGAGAIIKEGINIQGLTTAATIWVTASIGVAVGTGAYYIALITFSFTFIVLTLFGIIERVFNLKSHSGTLYLYMKRGYGLPKEELDYLHKRGVAVQRMSMERSSEGQCFTVDMDIPRRMEMGEFIERTDEIRGLKKVRWVDNEQKGPLSYLDNF